MNYVHACSQLHPYPYILCADCSSLVMERGRCCFGKAEGLNLRQAQCRRNVSPSWPFGMDCDRAERCEHGVGDVLL